MKITSEAQMKKGQRQVWGQWGNAMVFEYEDGNFQIIFKQPGKETRTISFTEYKQAKSFYYRLIALFKAVHDLEMIGIGVRHEVFL